MLSFESYYRERRGFEPFPWMVRLATRFANGDLPDVIDLPTGSGKSDVVLIWGWARTANPNLPRRVWAVSDRRVIVDQTYEIGRTLEGDGVRVSRLRGGIKTDPDSILDPITPQVVAATVDQVGSRLLFRGYGASPKSWPIWAGLVGNESLIILDEAHLSPNAEDTMRACCALGADAHVVSMTATPRGGENVFSLDEADHAHPILGKRLTARRMVELRKNGNATDIVREFLDDGRRRIAVICNTVRSAREVFGSIKHADKHLIIGRQRPLDRDRLMANLIPRLRSGADESEPLVVVATQCIEAGADFDFDAMVTELCPVDALRQRIGRLDRLGNMGESKCVMLGTSEKYVIPYGTAPLATWKWLSGHAKRNVIDLGFEGWNTIEDTLPDEARSARPDEISLLEPHMRMLARTSPRPIVEPDVDLLLHGHKATAGAISIVWRSDVSIDDVAASGEILDILSPTALEACEVPLREAHAWLDGIALEGDAGDIEGGELPNGSPDSNASVLRWLGRDDGVEVISASDLQPGDMVVMPSAVGGYDRFGWAPLSTEPVADLAELAFETRTERRIERKLELDGSEPSNVFVHTWSGGVVVEHLGDACRSQVVSPEVALDIHSNAVADRARTYAEALGLDVDALHFAGLHHDDGKANREWQLNINGDDLSRLATPLAKGRYVRSMLSRMPRGWRHEAESVRLLPDGTDDLIRWIIATHHGHARPLWPIPDHGIGLAELMDKMHREHGFWGIALFEAVLRCADRSISQEEMNDAA